MNDADIGRIEDPLPRVPEVVAGEGLAVGPLEAVAKGPRDGHRVAVLAGDHDATIVGGRDLVARSGGVLVVIGEDEQWSPTPPRYVGLGDLARVERVELVGFLPVADDDGAAVRAFGRRVGGPEESIRGWWPPTGPGSARTGPPRLRY